MNQAANFASPRARELFGSLGGQFTLSKLSAAVYALTFAIVYLQYFALFTIFGGTTPGMMFRGLQVASFTGDPPSPRPTGPGRSASMIRLIADVIARRAAGEALTDGQVMADHPELMPELLEELEGLRVLQRAWAAGQKAGPLNSPIAPVPCDGSPIHM